jgi:ureidoacrylate peracid hydrolase
MDLALEAEPEPITIDTEKAALIVVDMQNSLCKKGGMLDYWDKLDESMTGEVISACQRLIAYLRKINVPIIYLRMTYGLETDADLGPDSPFYWKEKGLVAERREPSLRGRFLNEGNWDWEIIDELRPEPGDTVINKSRYSGFVNTDLDATLQSMGIKYLLFAGLYTNCCVESTLRDAFHQEYFAILMKDACGTAHPDSVREATYYNVQNDFGWVTTVDNLIKSPG